MKRLILPLLLLLLVSPAWALDTDAADLQTPAPGAALGAEPAAASQPAAAQPAAAQPAECGDDPRLTTMADWLGGAPLNPKLSISPETFIAMDPEVLTMLGGQAYICPSIPLLKSGKTPVKVRVSFDALWAQLTSAASRGDTKEIQRLRATFLAAPLSPQEIAGLVARTGLEADVERKLYTALGLKIVKKMEGGFLIDVFVAFDGKSTQKAQLLLMDSSYDADFTTKMPSGSVSCLRPTIHDFLGGASPAEIKVYLQGALGKAGITAGDHKFFFGDKSAGNLKDTADSE